MKLICCNFKMNLLLKDIDNYINCLNKNKIDRKSIIFFPSAIYISKFHKNNYLVGCQDISFKEEGSITGDLSVKQLKELGASYTIIGHSEKRQYYNDDKYIKEKINIALKNKIKIILCVGEKNKTSEEETFEFLKKQIDVALNSNINLINNDNIIIAYEPIWSIGTGTIPSNNCISKTINLIKKHILDTYKIKIKVLYGGSVNKTNIDKLNELDNLDGFLIGGFSLQPENIINISRQK